MTANMTMHITHMNIYTYIYIIIQHKHTECHINLQVLSLLVDPEKTTLIHGHIYNI